MKGQAARSGAGARLAPQQLHEVAFAAEPLFDACAVDGNSLSGPDNL